MRKKEEKKINEHISSTDQINIVVVGCPNPHFFYYCMLLNLQLWWHVNLSKCAFKLFLFLLFIYCIPPLINSKLLVTKFGEILSNIQCGVSLTFTQLKSFSLLCLIGIYRIYSIKNTFLLFSNKYGKYKCFSN